MKKVECEWVMGWLLFEREGWVGDTDGDATGENRVAERWWWT